MWLFLAQEIMFFGGMFLAYSVYRALHTEAWIMASHTLDWRIGGLNTVVLLLSSWTVAMGVYYAEISKKKHLIACLIATLVLGLIFVVVKWIFEYTPKFEAGVFPGALWGPDPHDHHYGQLAGFADQGGLQLFYWLYYVMTGMHALHMIVGFGIILVLLVGAFRNKFHAQRYMPIMIFGLYWHFVDIVWVFLFPMYYLVS